MSEVLDEKLTIEKEESAEDLATKKTEKLKKRGKHFYDLAYKLSNNNSSTIPPSLRYAEASWYSYESYNIFLSIGLWPQAADSIQLCAIMSKVLKKTTEAAYLQIQLAQVYLKFDITESIVAYENAITLFIELKQLLLIAILNRIIGNLHLSIKHYEDAHISYQKASDYYIEIQKYIQSDICLEKASYCLIQLENYTLASYLYECIAEGCTLNNLRRYNSVEYLLYAIICLLAVPTNSTTTSTNNTYTNTTNILNTSTTTLDADNTDLKTPKDKKARTIIETEYKEKYSNILNIMDGYKLKDYLWKCSKEYLFLYNIITARMCYDLDTYIKHVYFYGQARKLPYWVLGVLHMLCKEIEQELEARRLRVDSIVSLYVYVIL